MYEELRALAINDAVVDGGVAVARFGVDVGNHGHEGGLRESPVVVSLVLDKGDFPGFQGKAGVHVLPFFDSAGIPAWEWAQDAVAGCQFYQAARQVVVAVAVGFAFCRIVIVIRNGFIWAFHQGQVADAVFVFIVISVGIAGAPSFYLSNRGVVGQDVFDGEFAVWFYAAQHSDAGIRIIGVLGKTGKEIADTVLRNRA